MIRRAVGSVALSVCAMFATRVAPAQQPVPQLQAGTAAPAVPDAPAPHIKFDAVDVNLGDVVHGQDAVATYTYHNTGDAPLHILSAKPG